jgi:multiple antibiotic resistance protein
MAIGPLEIALILLITSGPLRAMLAFDAMTAAADPALRARIARRAALTMAVALVAFLVLGQALLSAMKIDLPALQIAGGIILLAWSLSALGAASDAPPPATTPPALAIAIHPLGLPMLASPQAITAVVVIGASARESSQQGMIVAAIAVVALIDWATLHWARPILARVPAGAIQAVIRIVALLLAAMAVQSIVFGMVGLGIVDPARLS